MSAGRTTGPGSHLRAPFSVYSDAKKTLVEIVDASGVVVAALGDGGSITSDTLVATNKKLEFRASSQYINSPSAGKIAIITTPAAADDIQLTGGVNVTGTLAVSGAVALASTLASGALTVTGAASISTTLAVTGASTLTGALAVTAKVTSAAGIQARGVAVTATADGLTTGIIADDTSVAIVTSSVNTKLVTLPTPTPGVVVWIPAEATGYNLRSSTPASIAINGGTGSGAKSAVSAKTLRCFCASATAWVVTAFDADGTVSALAAAS